MKNEIIVVLAATLLSACATTEQYAPAATPDTLKAGNALIRVERESGVVGGGRSVEVTDNGVKTGSLAPGAAITWQRPAGPMAINLAPAALAVGKLQPIHVDVVAGQRYEFTVSWSWGDDSFVLRRK